MVGAWLDRRTKLRFFKFDASFNTQLSLCGDTYPEFLFVPFKLLICFLLEVATAPVFAAFYRNFEHFKSFFGCAFDF
jgi:hypothetical protein